MRARGPLGPWARGVRLAGAMDKTETPRNQEGQPPTRSAADTEERLGEKEHADRGQANKDRIEAKISALKD